MRIDPLFFSTLLFSTTLSLAACGGKGEDTSDSGSSGSSSTSTGSSSTAGTSGSTDATGSGGMSEGTTGVTTGATSTTSLTTGSTTDGTTVATTVATTDGPPDGSCREQADCDLNGGEICFAPDEANCGACQVPDLPCMVDDDCGADAVCVPFEAPCACNPGENNCVPLKSCKADRDCAPEERCDAGTCVIKTCSQDGLPCPPFFDCVQGSGGNECQRIFCVSDEDCEGGGFCVKSRCFEVLGMCELPAP